MHLSDGVLSVPLVAGGLVGAGVLCAWGASRIRDDEIPRVAVLAATFFAASLVHFKFGPTSVHLLLSGLVGVVLGRRALLVFPVALALQFLLLGHGGLTTLGVNSCLFGVAALGARGVYVSVLRVAGERYFLAGFLAGAAGVLLAGLLVMGILLTVGEGFRVLAQYALVAHLPVLVIEGIATGLTVRFLHQVQPRFLEASPVSNSGGLGERAPDEPSRAPSLHAPERRISTSCR